MTVLDVVGAAILKDGRCLVARRGPGMALAGLWEFPGGRVEPRESDAQALCREFAERLGDAVQLQVGDLISFVSHPYEHYTVDLYLYQCAFADVSAPLETRSVHGFRWVTSDEFDELPFTPADEASMSQLLGEG